MGATHPPMSAASVVDLDRPVHPLVVEVEPGWVDEQRLDDAPLLVERVGLTEAAGVTEDGVLEQPLVHVLARPERRLVGDLEVDRLRGQLLAGSLRLEVQDDAVIGTPTGTGAGWVPVGASAPPRRAAGAVT